MKRPASRETSQKDIAEKLGLSRATVANILSPTSGKLPYSAETRARVLRTAKEMGYQVNRASRAIRTGRSNLLGIIHFGTLPVALPQAVNAEGYDSLVVDLRWHGGDVERTLGEMIRARVEGVIICLSIESFTTEHIAILERAGIPCVTLYGDDRLGIPLFADNAASTYCALAHHLMRIGHRRLLLLASKIDSRWKRERVEGFRAAIKPHGPVPAYSEQAFLKSGPSAPTEEKGGISAAIVELDLKRRGHDATLANFEFGKRLFALPDWRGAVLCFNDESAYGLHNAAFLSGRSVPQEIALTGFDDRKYSGYPIHDLTTISTDVAEASAAAVGALASFIKGESASITGQTFGSSLVLRGSCGRRKTGGEPEQIIPVPPDYHKQQIANQVPL